MKAAKLTPNFWRAPTDNDMGAGLQNRYAAWKKPGLKLTSLTNKMENGQAVVNAEYTMEAVSAKLSVSYTINNEGAVKVTQKMIADKSAKVSDMFRFGMQMQMCKVSCLFSHSLSFLSGFPPFAPVFSFGAKGPICSAEGGPARPAP